MSEYSKEKIKAELHEKYENGEIDDVELEERLFALEDASDENIDYFAELGKSDELIIPDEGLGKISKTRSIFGSRFAENKDLQEKLEELVEKNKPTEKEIKEQEELPTTLSGFRSYYGLTKYDERELLVNIYNCEIRAKVNYRQDMQSKPPEINPKTGLPIKKRPVFARTKLSDTVSKFSQLEDRYSKRSLDAKKNKLRKLFFDAAGGEIYGTDVDFYTPNRWCGVVMDAKTYGVDHITEGDNPPYPELVECIFQLIQNKGSNYDGELASYRKKHIKKEPKSNPLSELLEEKDNFDFTYQLFADFFSEKRIQDMLNHFDENDFFGWEKWWQSEMGVYIENHNDIMEWNKEESFLIDGRARKGKNKNKITIDLSYRRKKYAKDKFIFVELKQSDDTKKCIENMCDDVAKVRSARKKSQYNNQIRDLFSVGVHPKQELPDDEIQKLVISKLKDKHEDFIKISNIPNTKYVYTIF